MTDAYTPPQSDLTGHNAKLGAITEEMVSALRGTKGWVLLIVILLFIGAAITAVMALVMMVGGAAMGAAAQGMPSGMFAGMGVLYLVMALIYVFQGTYLVRYSSAIGRLLEGGREADMEAALNQQQKFWRLAGVLALIFVVLFLVGMVAAIALPAMMMRHG